MRSTVLAVAFIVLTLAGGLIAGGAHARSQSYEHADLSGMDFSGQDLRGQSFAYADLTDVNFRGANLAGANFAHANFKKGDLSGANLQGANLTYVDFDATLLCQVNFQQADLQHADMLTSFVYGADFRGANLRYADVNMQNVNANPGPCAAIPAAAPARGFVTQQQIVQQLTREVKPGEQAHVDLTVNFAFDSDKILNEGHKQILEIAQALQSDALKQAPIRIEGHTDSDGTDDYNMDLSYRRAVRVKRELVEKYGVPSGNLSIEGYGERKPVASNTTDAGKALNRRVTLVRVN